MRSLDVSSKNVSHPSGQAADQATVPVGHSGDRAGSRSRAAGGSPAPRSSVVTEVKLIHPVVKSVTRKEFLAVTGGQPHHAESHFAWGAVCQWFINGWVMEEHQPDVGKVKWFWCTEAANA